jgi:uncharacterized protein (TIGR02996 family)
MAPWAEIAEIVVAAPHNDGALAVLGDWLQEHGDPRGELIARSLQPERTPELTARITELSDALSPAPSCRGVTWRKGFVHRAVISGRDIDGLVALLGSSASWGLSEVIVFRGCHSDPADPRLG